MLWQYHHYHFLQQVYKGRFPFLLFHMFAVHHKIEQHIMFLLLLIHTSFFMGGFNNLFCFLRYVGIKPIQKECQLPFYNMPFYRIVFLSGTAMLSAFISFTFFTRLPTTTCVYLSW